MQSWKRKANLKWTTMKRWSLSIAKVTKAVNKSNTNKERSDLQARKL